MQVTRKNVSETKVVLSVSAAEAYLAPFKEKVLNKLAGEVKLPGFREGKAPLNLVEKNVNPQTLQGEFVEEAINNLYVQAVNEEKLRPIDNPKISLKKFVPFSQLEFEAEVEVLGPIKLPDYKKIKVSPQPVTVTEADIKKVLDDLQTRMAESKEVKRAAKAGDKTTIDFKGVDAKNQAVKGADGRDYPLLLGSDTFIPGFEKNLIGLKPGESKEFTLTFPKDYGVKTLANSKVTFTVTVKKLEEQTKPKLDDAFAAKVGPFKSLKELKDDIKRQLTAEREQQAHQALESEIIKKVTDKTQVAIPQALIDDQVERLKAELRQNLTYRGLTYQEYLEREGVTEEAYLKDVLIPEATERVKAGLVLAEVADKEGISLTNDELNARMNELKQQYTDVAMQAELDKPEARESVASRLMTEKTMHKLLDYATS